MRSAEITLGGKTYTVEQLPIGENRAWRQKFDEPVNKLLAATQGIGALAGENFADFKELTQTIGTVLVQHADNIIRILLESPDMLLNGVYDYAPVIKADQKRIEEKAYDDEIGAAFLEVVKLAYPFGSLMNLVKLGQETPGTSQNSAEANGDSGQKN